MIFPQDVHKIIQNKNTIAGDNKVQLYIVLFVLGNVGGFFGLQVLFAYIAPEIPGTVAIIIQLIILAFVMTLVFRFAIFDENDKKKEHEGQQTDSFAKYMYLRKDLHNEVEVFENKVNVFEFVNGSAMCVIEFRFGGNDDKLAKGTEQLYEQMFKCIGEYFFESRCYVMPENFLTSKEYKTHIDSINQIEDIVARRTMMSVTDEIMKMSQMYSCTDSVYVVIRSTTNYQRADLENMLKQLINIFSKNVHAFRSITFLSLSPLLEFLRDFYGIEAIDLGMMKTIELAEDISIDFARLVKVYSLTSETGKTYKVSHNDIFSIKERELK